MVQYSTANFSSSLPNLLKVVCNNFGASTSTLIMIANTPAPPYYAVIFTSIKSNELDGYEEMSVLMFELAAAQPGYLGVESAPGITISYWKDEMSILHWKQHADHRLAQIKGREQWYLAYTTRVCKVERDYSFKL